MNSTQDWFLMTGDLIINLQSTKTGDPILNSKQAKCKNSKQKQFLDGNQNQVKSCEDVEYETKGGDEDFTPTCNESENSHHATFDEPEVAKQPASSETSNSSSGVVDELSNSQVSTDSFSPYKTESNETSSTTDKYLEDFYYKKEQEDNYENIGDCVASARYLSKSHESNFYNLIEDSKSFDNVSLDSENGFFYNSSSSSSKYILDPPSVSRLAKRLFNLEGFQKTDVSCHLSKNNEFSRALAEEYLKLCDFSGLNLDEALRLFLSRLTLVGETQDRERVLVYFAKRYHECNIDNSNYSTDSIHTLTCALMLLNTDLHDEAIHRKMTCHDFIQNLSGLNDGSDYDNHLLKCLYYSIKNNPLGWNSDVVDDGKKEKVFSKITTISKTVSSSYETFKRKCNTLNMNPFVEVPNPSFAIEYKKGYLRRKCCYEANGKRTALGKRDWKLFYATLRDLVLYLHRDEKNGYHKSLNESLTNSIRIHHAIASIAQDYLKKKFVFRLITADFAEYLFEASDSRELRSWVNTINATAASLSAPSLPMAVSSDTYKFKREVFPVSHTKLTLRDQLRDQENKLLSLQKELELLLENSHNNRKKNFAETESYLQHELNRYRVYISCLKWKLANQNDHELTTHERSGSYSDHDSTLS